MLITILEKETNKHLIILVHGLNGGASTWEGNVKRYVETFKRTQLIQDNFDVASFVYTTKIIQWTRLKRIINLIRGFVANRTKENIDAFNVGVDQISRTLESEIRSCHEKYETITIIAHSMGGLVTKSALTWINNKEIIAKIKLLISLDVPHIGAELAKLGKRLLGDNPQIIDLQAMGEFTTLLNQRFANVKPQPLIIYTWGHQDSVVPEASAIPYGVSTDLTERTGDDHFSVVLIENPQTNIIFKRIVKELNNLLQPITGIDVDVPEGMTFGSFITWIAPKLKAKVDLSAFSDEELETPLSEGHITSSIVEDFFVKVGDLTIKTFSKYEVLREGNTGNYTFIKK